MDRWLNLPVAPTNADDEAGGGLGIERTALINSTDQLGDLKKRLSSIRSLDDKPIPTSPVEVREVGEDGTEVSLIVIEVDFLGEY